MATAYAFTGDSSDKTQWYNPSSLLKAFEILFGGEDELDTSKDNLRAIVGWSMVGGYVLGNSLGTAHTLSGARRFNVGPVYVW